MKILKKFKRIKKKQRIHLKWKKLIFQNPFEIFQFF